MKVTKRIKGNTIEETVTGTTSEIDALILRAQITSPTQALKEVKNRIK